MCVITLGTIEDVVRLCLGCQVEFDPTGLRLGVDGYLTGGRVLRDGRQVGTYEVRASNYREHRVTLPTTEGRRLDTVPESFVWQHSHNVYFDFTQGRVENGWRQGYIRRIAYGGIVGLVQREDTAAPGRDRVYIAELVV